MDWNYTRPETVSGGNGGAAEGKLRCVIMDAREGKNRDGIPRIEIFVKPSGFNFKVMKTILHNEKFDANASRFFDAFPEIGDGNFNFATWIGAMGAAEFEKDEDGYTKVKWWLYPSKAKDLPPFEGTRPEKQELTIIGGVNIPADEADEDFPF